MGKQPRRSLKFSANACFFLLASILPVLILPVSILPVASASGQTTANQTADAKLPAYDVVSVKVDKSGSGHWDLDSRDGRYSANNVSLKNLVSSAYGMKEDLISGIPGWANSARFDLQAKIVDPDLVALKKLSPEQEQSLLKPVLADRFQLRAHTETKILPVFDLVLAKGGPKFKPTSPDDPSGKGGSISIHNAALTAHAIPMQFLARSLSSQMHRMVIDKTGLAGRFDLSFTWTPAYGPGATPEDSESSIFTALQEQLGLKLRSAKGPVETLVIDHVEMPSEN